MLNDKQAAQYLQRELGQTIIWCYKVIDDFKSFAFLTARHFGKPPLDVMLGIARSIIAQEARDRGPDLEEEVSNRLTVRRRKQPSLSPQQYTSEDVEFLRAV